MDASELPNELLRTCEDNDIIGSMLYVNTRCYVLCYMYICSMTIIMIMMMMIIIIISSSSSII